MNSLLPLKFIWEFISPLLQHTIKDHIKLKDSNAIAKERSYDLYKRLGDVNQLSDKFVNEFQIYVEMIKLHIENKAPNLSRDPEIRAKGESLKRLIEQLIIPLGQLSKALAALSPQLDIHKPELVERVGTHVEVRGGGDFKSKKRGVLVEVEEAIDELPFQSLDVLSNLLAQAEENHLLIQNVINDYRDFLAKEFPFKDSF